MPNLFKGVVKLTEDQYKTLLKGGSFDFNGQTIVYDANTLYVTDYSIDGELDVNSLNPVTNRAIALALNDKAGKEEIPANVVTTNTEQDIEGDKNFVGNVTKNGVNLATIDDIKVTDTLDHQYDDYALSVRGGMVLNDKITTLIENVNGRVQSFSLNSLNDLLTLFNITTNTDEAMEQYPVSTKNITYMDKEYTLKTGDIFLIVDTDVPDYWFSADTMMLYKMETMKIDLTNYVTHDFLTNSLKNKAEQSSLDVTNQNVASNTSEIANLKTNQKTKLSELESDSTHRTVTDTQITNWDKKLDSTNLNDYATKDYVNENGGKIDKIYLNDVEQEIVNKEVHLEIEIPEQEQITDYYKVGNKLTGINLNTIVIPGNYGVANDCTNMPIKENGTLFVGEYDKGTYVQQLFISASNEVYSRSSTSVDNSTWNAWELMAKDSKFDNYLPLSGNKTILNSINFASGKRIQDSKGNNLLVNYADSKYTYVNGTGNVLVLQGSSERPIYEDLEGNSTNLALLKDIPNVDGFAKTSDLSNYLPLTGGQMTGPLSWRDNYSILPMTTPEYIVTLDSFANGGNTCYVSIENLKTTLGIPSLTGYATETYVNNAIKDLIGSAPDTLNTLEELANAIGDNKEIVDALGETYVPLDGSKAMTGILTNNYGFKSTNNLSLYANGDLYLKPSYNDGNNISDGLVLTSNELYPSTSAKVDLGTSTYKFKNLYLDGSIVTNTDTNKAVMTDGYYSLIDLESTAFYVGASYSASYELILRGGTHRPTYQGPTLEDSIVLNEDLKSYMGHSSLGSKNANECYDMKLYMCGGGSSNLPSGSQYGTLLTLPYRKSYGNEKPDFGTQIFLPNGDDATKPNSMFYRTSWSTSWQPWQEVVSTNHNAYKYAEEEFNESCNILRITGIEDTLSSSTSTNVASVLDGNVVLNGTTPITTTGYLRYDDIQFKDNTTYTFKMFNSKNSADYNGIVLLFDDGSTADIYFVYGVKEYSFNTSEKKLVNMRVWLNNYNTTYSNYVINLMIVEGTTTPSSFYKYNENKQITNNQAYYLEEKYNDASNLLALNKEFIDKSGFGINLKYDLNTYKFNVKGTVTEDNNFIIMSGLNIVLEPGTYTFAMVDFVNNQTDRLLIYLGNGGWGSEFYINNYGNGPAYYTTTLTTKTTLDTLRFWTQVTLGELDYSFRLMLVKGNSVPKNYFPYNPSSHLENSKADLLNLEFENSKNKFDAYSFVENAKKYTSAVSLIDKNSIQISSSSYIEHKTNLPLNLKEKIQYTISFDYAWVSHDNVNAKTGLLVNYSDGTYDDCAFNAASESGSVSITSDENKTIVSISCSGWAYGGTAKLSNIQLEEGTSKTLLNEYNEKDNLTNEESRFVVNTYNKHKNLFDYTKFNSTGYTTNNHDGSFSINGAFYYDSQAETSSNLLNVNIKKGVTYTMSLLVEEYSNSDGGPVQTEFLGRDANGELGFVGTITLDGAKKRYAMQIISDRDVTKIAIRFLRKNNATSTLTGKVSHVMICEGIDSEYCDFNGTTVGSRQIRLLQQLVPEDSIPIPQSSNLLDKYFFKVGTYHVEMDGVAASLINCPTARAFMMTVYAPINASIDDEENAIHKYRIRKIMDYTGNEFIQRVQVGAEAGSWYSYPWKKISTTSFSFDSTTGTLTITD